MAKKRRKKACIPGLVITIVLLLIAFELMAVLAVTNLLPFYLILATGIVVLTCIMFVGYLTGNYRKKMRFVIGVILSVVLLVIFVIGNLYVFKTYNTLTKISGVSTKTSHIGIYVLEDDLAETIEDAQDYTFGILSGLDTDNTTEAVAQINEALNTSIETQEKEGITELVDSLLNGEYGAIIMNEAYLAVVEDIEGYEDIDDQIRELQLMSVDTVIEDVTTETEEEENHIIRLYISGIDTRGTTIVNTRSDVNIIATINTDTKQILLVSTPRDYFIPLSISNGAEDKLTHAGIYGVDVSMDTLSMLYDVNINYYFKVNFTGFVDIIDALGGIEVESDYAFSSDGYTFTEGTNYLAGEAALAFARERKTFSEGDRQRGKNQMAIIEGVINKVMSTDFLTNYMDVLSSVEDCFETNFSYDDIADLVREQLDSGSDWNIVSYSVDGTSASRIPYSMSTYAYVMIPDEETVEMAKTLMQQVVDGEILSFDDTEEEE